MPLKRRCRYRVHQEVKTKCEKAWTNKQILGEVFRPIIKSDYEKAGDQKTRQELIEALENPDPAYIFWKLVHLQFDALSFFVAYLDGAAGPTEWPGVDLVNASTRGTLSGDFGLGFAHFDGVYTEENAINLPIPCLYLLSSYLQASGSTRRTILSRRVISRLQLVV